MDEASQVRRAAREAVEDIAPEPFGEAVERTLAEESVAPGVLAVLCARAADEEVAFAALADRAAGTQLIYEGLRLTRDLANAPPWERTDDGERSDDGASTDDASENDGATRNGADAAIGEAPAAATTRDAATIEDANVAVLVADVLVARGFYLLARTEAADRAVETVRAFGRDETRDGTDPDARTNGLEADVFELAAVAGTTAVGESPPSALRAFVTDRADELDGELPPASVLFGAGTTERLGALVAPVADGGSADGNRNG